jgi:hypothetical protein
MTAYNITACSSEDPKNPVSNLKNADLYRTWQTNGYVKKATVDIAFSKPTKIALVDIGNAGSAFVELLVGKQDSSDEQFQVLVPINSQMGVHDSKNGINKNRTKCFEKFTTDVGNKEWDRMRIVCTQPFTNNSAFGLSYLFINQRNQSPSSPSPSSSSSATTTTSTPSSANKLDKNKIKNTEDDEDADTDVDEESSRTHGERNIAMVKRENSELIKKLKNEMKQKNKVEVDNNTDSDSNSYKHNGKGIKNLKHDSDEDTNKNTPNNKKQKDTNPKVFVFHYFYSLILLQFMYVFNLY